MNKIFNLLYDLKAGSLSLLRMTMSNKEVI